MKTLIQSIIVILALTMLTAGIVSAKEIVRPAVELQIQQAELEQQSRAEVAAVLAQAQTRQPPVPVLPTTPSPAPAPTQMSVSNVNDNIYTMTRGLSFGSRAGSTGTVLVIPSEQTNTEDLLTINEDMSVMSRIFEKSLEQDLVTTVRSSFFISRRRDPFSGMYMGDGTGQIQSMYLQGYGALFLLKVDFPLSPLSDVQEQEQEQETQKAEDGDPVWRQMRQEMYEPDKVDRRRRPDRPEEKYDAEKVENLKTTLIQALKHAANIRSLKPDESVILTVTGSGQATGRTITAVTRSGENQIIVSERGGDGNTRTRLVQGTSLDDIGSSSPTILVIRTKKSDIDEFAKGDLDFEKFRKRVQLLTYPLLGGADGYGDPFNPYMGPRSTGSSSRR